MALPSGYTPLEYIKASGTQYINTGFLPNQDTTVEFSAVNAAANQYFFGAWNVAYNDGAFAFCNDPSNVYMIRDVASVFSVFIVGGERGDLYSVNEVPHGTVSRIWYESPGLKMNRRLTVYTPAGYEKGGKYPVFYLLHGAGGDEEAWINLGRTSQILDNLIAQGKVEPMIVVMTNGNAWQQAAPGESPLGYTVPSMGTGAQRQAVEADFVSTFPDVVKFVEKTYRVKKGKANRAIAGLSMGAYHSCAISRLYPDMFDYVGLFRWRWSPQPQG